MVRIILATLLALTLHALLFTISADHLKKKLPLKKPEPISLSLTYIYPEKEIPPVINKPMKPLKKIELPKEEPKKKVISPKEKKQITPILKKQPEIIPIKEPVIKPVISPVEEEPIREVPVEDIPGVPVESVPKEQETQEVKTEPVESPTPPPVPIAEAIPRYRENPVPKYPKMAKRRGLEGIVIIEVLVNAQGRVDDMRLYKSSGYSMLDTAAMDSVKNWLFVPGKKGDQTIDMWVRVPVRFELR